MLLLLHIIIALSSLAYASLLLLRPSHEKMNMSRNLVIATIASGTALVFVQPSHIVQACVSGLTYISIVLVIMAAARYKLVRVRNK